MKTVNKVLIVGNVSRITTLKEGENGVGRYSFGVATNREWKTKTKELKSVAEFHNVVAWGWWATHCSEHLEIGKYVLIEGYLNTLNWEEDGKTFYKTEIVVENLIFLDKKTNKTLDKF